MSVLPALERELARAHRTRYRRRHRVALGFGAVGLTVATAVIVVVVVLLGSTVSASGPHGARPANGLGPAAPPRSGAPGFGPSRVLAARTFADSGWVYGGTLYLDEQLGVSPPRGLVALDPATGRLLGRISLGPAVVDDVVLGDGSIWVTTTQVSPLKSATTLFRLSPGRLALRSSVTLPGRASQSTADGSMAVIAGRLWVSNGGRLIAIAPSTGRSITQIVVPGERQLELRAARGALYVSAGNGGGRARVERRDPVTGALRAASAIFEGVTQPRLSIGPYGPLWISEATGMAGYIERLDPQSLQVLAGGAPSHANTSNGIRAQVIGGALWVSETGGGSRENYCGDPVSGRPRLAMPASERAGLFLTADASRIYYVRYASNGAGRLMAATIGTRCGG